MSVFDTYTLRPKFSAGAYSCYAGGQRASSTVSAEAALTALASKLWGPGKHLVRPSGTDGWWAIERHAAEPTPPGGPKSITWHPMSEIPQGVVCAMIRASDEDGAHLLPGPVRWDEGHRAWIDDATDKPQRLRDKGAVYHWADEKEIVQGAA